MPLIRTPEALAQIEQQIIASHGDLMLACRSLNVSPLEVNQWVASEPEAAQAVHNAQRLGWATLESEAIRRATGYDEEVWFQGEMVGTKRVYSDGLLQTLLKARVPGHREDQALSRPMVQVNVLPRATTYEEWQAQRQSVLDVSDAARAAHMLMAPPDDLQEAEYTEIGNGLPDWL